jgi:phage gp29-like protein
LIGKPPSPPVPDPAWQPPRDPLAGADMPAVAKAISREVPLVVVATGWDVPQARAAINSLVIGLFDTPAQMADAIIRSDSRVQAGLTSRLSILGRPVDFVTPRKYRDSAAARECRDAFIDAWPTMASEPVMSELQRWAIIMGFGAAQILWDTSGEYAIPHPLPWHLRYTYYHWQYRCLVAITMDGQEPVIGGDGHWILHAPHGEYRGWMRGAIGAITPWWLARNYALRDWARYSERHGLPMIKAKTPAVGDPNQQAVFRNSLANIGQETVLHLPQNPAPALSYDVELLEAKDTAHEGFRLLIEQCNQEITLALNAQTLTTAMPAEGGSSYAAARVHAGVLQGLLEADARALAFTIYRDLSRAFAAMNFGDPDLAPRVVWDVTPFEDAATKATAFQSIATAINLLYSSGIEIEPRDIRRMLRDTIPGFDPGKVKRSVKREGIFAYELDRGVAQINEARERKGLPPMDGGDRTWPEIQKSLGLAPGGGGGGGSGSPEARARIAAMGERFDPHTLKRSRIALDDEGTREALAWAEADQAARMPRRRART